MSCRTIPSRVLPVLAGLTLLWGCATDRSTVSGPAPTRTANFDTLGIDPAAGAALFSGPAASAAQAGAAYADACIPVVGMRIEESSAHARSLGYAGGNDLDTRELRTKNVFHKGDGTAPGSIVTMFQTARSDGTAKGGCSVTIRVADPGTAEQATRQYLLANTAMIDDGPNSIKLENGMVAASDGTMLPNGYLTGFTSKRIATGNGEAANILVITSVTELARG